MQEICQSGSEGGAKPTFVPTPILAQGLPWVLGLSAQALKGPPLTRRPGNHVSECRCPFRARHIKTRFPG